MLTTGDAGTFLRAEDAAEGGRIHTPPVLPN